MKPPEALVLAAAWRPAKEAGFFRSPTTIAVSLENLVVISLGFIADSSPRIIV
jgi:hypothetical protein